jgi:signal transduction histidine kinase
LLRDFLIRHRIEILELTEKKSIQLAGPLLSSKSLRSGLPLFLDQMIAYLDLSLIPTDKKMVSDAAKHGKELHRLDYTLSHVVHSYGAICQAITELIHLKGSIIDPIDFNELNRCLDIAIAASVTEFQFQTNIVNDDLEAQSLGYLVHELRNSLSSATIAHDMIKQGLVGTSGSTAKVLEQSLARMRDLIDRSLSVVRMRSEPEVRIEKFEINALLEQIILTARSTAKVKNQVLNFEQIYEVELSTDRQLLLSAIANLVQNAIKYSKEGGHINIRSQVIADHISIEVEDECGGIDPLKIDSLFKPFRKGSNDQTGLGLGLVITRRAIGFLQGTVTVRNSGQTGCVFIIDIPINLGPAFDRIVSVPGEESIHPPPNKLSRER